MLPFTRTLRALLSGLALPLVASSPRFLERSVVVEGQTYRYQVFVPEKPAPGPVPLVLFLHGSGERGADNTAQLGQGLPPWLAAHGEAFPALVVIPQAGAEEVWTGRASQAAMAALRATRLEFKGDARRTYLTGLSMGGYGSWELLFRHPRTFAAAAIICGGVEPLGELPAIRLHGLPGRADPFRHTAAHIGRTPVWIFHGGADDVVPVEQSRRMAAALKQAGVEVKYTEFPDVGHGSWKGAYETDGLWPWMFGHSR